MPVSRIVETAQAGSCTTGGDDGMKFLTKRHTAVSMMSGDAGTPDEPRSCGAKADLAR